MRKLRVRCALSSHEGPVEDWLCLISEYQRMILERLERIESQIQAEREAPSGKAK
jgi:hypothetical protein